MSYMSNLYTEIQEMAFDLNDEFGDDADTVITISRVFNVSPVVVQDILSPENVESSEYGYKVLDF